MPTRPFRASVDLDDAQFCIAAARVLQSADDDDADDMAGLLFFAAAEQMMRCIRQEIGNEHLSVENIRRDAAAQGFGGDVFSANIYDRFGFHLDELEIVVEKLQVPLMHQPDLLGEQLGYWAVRFIRVRWAHLVDERSFTEWAPWRGVGIVENLYRYYWT
ncbi:hypothetical protein AB1Y20_010551 [Prymnesium parvum]|uniref:Queuosine salvage protein n=1 Tax=Prymnesium parvum TaxID=97485 RepID=A0AB34IP10_PRYPA